jgi:hypothetical protein
MTAGRLALLALSTTLGLGCGNGSNVPDGGAADARGMVLDGGTHDLTVDACIYSAECDPGCPIPEPSATGKYDCTEVGHMCDYGESAMACQCDHQWHYTYCPEIGCCDNGGGKVCSPPDGGYCPGADLAR